MSIRPHARFAALAVCAVLVSGCGAGRDGTGADATPTEAEPDTARCVLDPPPAATKAITAGLDSGVELAEHAVIVRTQAHERVDTGWPKAVYAALLTGKGSGAATWAMDDPDQGSGPVVAISDPARNWSTYADSGGNSGSAQTRRTIAELEATVSAQACVLDLPARPPGELPVIVHRAAMSRGPRSHSVQRVRGAPAADSTRES